MPPDRIMYYAKNPRNKNEELVWKTTTPTAGEIGQFNIDCQYGNKPQLSDYGDDLVGNEDPVAFIKKMITPDMIQW